MHLPTSASTDRIAASAASSYGLFWAIALGAAIFDRRSFRPDVAYYVAAGFALLYVALGVIAFLRIKGSRRLLQIVTVIVSTLILIAFGVMFVKEGTLGRGLLAAFAQLQVAYAASVCLLLGHTCQPAQRQVENS